MFAHSINKHANISSTYNEFNYIDAYTNYRTTHFSLNETGLMRRPCLHATLSEPVYIAIHMYVFIRGWVCDTQYNLLERV